MLHNLWLKSIFSGYKPQKNPSLSSYRENLQKQKKCIDIFDFFGILPSQYKMVNELAKGRGYKTIKGNGGLYEKINHYFNYFGTLSNF